MINTILPKPPHELKNVQEHRSIEITRNIQPGGDEGLKLPFLIPILERGEGQTDNNSFPQPIVTIEDLEDLAKKLLTGIEILKSYKYPLAVRRGVKRT